MDDLEPLAALLMGRRTDRGGFALIRGPRAAASVPRVLADRPSRAGPGPVARHLLAAPADGRTLARLAAALRQEVGRNLQGARGCAPVGAAEAAAGGVLLTAMLTPLDGAAAAPGALDALRRIFHDGERARWAAWALRGARGRGACSRRS